MTETAKALKKINRKLKGPEEYTFLFELVMDEDNNEIFLTLGTITDSYFIVETLKKEFDFTTGRGFPVSNLM